jgi:hypothetical protein
MAREISMQQNFLENTHNIRLRSLGDGQKWNNELGGILSAICNWPQTRQQRLPFPEEIAPLLNQGYRAIKVNWFWSLAICSAANRMTLSFCSIIASNREGCPAEIMSTNLTKGEHVSVCEAKLMAWKDKKRYLTQKYQSQWQNGSNRHYKQEFTAMGAWPSVII